MESSSAKICRNIQDEADLFSGLPGHLVENVISRLSVKNIVTCKCVCKMWYKMISNPEFAKQHCDRGQICPLIRSSGPTFLSRILYVVQEEQVSSIERMLDVRVTEEPHCGCVLYQVGNKLNTKLRLPLRNFESIPNNVLIHETNKRRDNSMKFNMKNHNYKVVNSCNGLICLSKPIDNDPVIVCNPVTGEFINLPEARTDKYREFKSLKFRPFASGFGFSPRTNQYKVIRAFVNYKDGTRDRELAAEVLVLGINSWRGIDRSHQLIGNLCPTSLNGYLYWLCKSFVASFSIDEECFGEVPLPPLRPSTPYGNVAMGVLGGELCTTEVDINDVNIWALKNSNGGEGCWSKIFSFCLFSWLQIRPHGSLIPIQYLNGKKLLMFNSHLKGFIVKDLEKVGYKCISVWGMDSQVEAIVHTPSFVSLTDILRGVDVEVLNVNSRCGPLRLPNESKVVALLEEDH